jgi:hypothetical protein
MRTIIKSLNRITERPDHEKLPCNHSPANDKNDFYECEAESEFDAKQKAGWAYVREGVVTAVSEI